MFVNTWGAISPKRESGTSCESGSLQICHSSSSRQSMIRNVRAPGRPRRYDTSVGLISFSDSVHVDVEACQNVKRIERAIDGLECGRTGYGNATDPFDELRRRLSAQACRRFAIVLADGVWSDQREAVRKAVMCHEQGIEVVGVGFGGADAAFLREISTSDENSIFTDLSRLVETFSAIAQEITEGKPRSLIRG